MTGPGSDDALSPRIPRDVLSAVLDGQAVLLDLASGVYHGLDGVGTRIWELLAEHDSLGGVRAAMLAEFEVEPERLDRDLREFLSAMIERGLLEEGGGAAPGGGATAAVRARLQSGEGVTDGAPAGGRRSRGRSTEDVG